MVATSVAHAVAPQETPTKEIIQEKRPRGRPKGSKNKPKETQETPTKEIIQEKRPRGRPKGSKNKPKITNTPVKEVAKQGRRTGTKDIHTRKSKKSTHAATIIQQRWRSR